MKEANGRNQLLSPKGEKTLFGQGDLEKLKNRMGPGWGKLGVS